MAKIPEPVVQCVAILKNTTELSDKISALFLASKLLKSKECNGECKMLLFDSIGVELLKKLLLTKEDIDYPPELYKSITLNIITAFCADPTLAEHEEVLSLIPILLNIITEGDSYGDENLILVREAYGSLEKLVAFKSACALLMKHDAVNKLCKLYSEQSFETEKALNILAAISQNLGLDTWNNITSTVLNNVLNSVAVEFDSETGNKKIELNKILKSILSNIPKKNISSYTDNTWPDCLRKSLNAILTSKVEKGEREASLMLISVMCDIFGIQWTLGEDNKKQFFLILVNMFSIEVRMQIEQCIQKNKQEIFEFMIRCMRFLQFSVEFISKDTLELDDKEKQHLYVALKSAFNTIYSSLKYMYEKKYKTNDFSLDDKDSKIILSMLEALAVWLGQQASTMIDSINEILPFILKVANSSFDCYVSAHKKTNFSSLTEDLDLLYLMLPALSHLVINDNSRKIVLNCKEENILFECLSFHWSIVNYKKPVVPKSERLKTPNLATQELSEGRLNEISNSKVALINICNIFMNLSALEHEECKKSIIFSTLLKFILNNSTELKSTHENLILHGNLAVLGLLLLKQQSEKISKDDFTICRYLQSTITFLWDAYTIDESHDPTRLSVSMDYKRYWLQLTDLWFLGMQTISSVIKQLPWISEFAIESGWIQGLLKTLKSAKSVSVQSNVKMAFEDLFCTLVEVNEKNSEILKQYDALTVCRRHQLMRLGKMLFGD